MNPIAYLMAELGRKRRSWQAIDVAKGLGEGNVTFSTAKFVTCARPTHAPEKLLQLVAVDPDQLISFSVNFGSHVMECGAYRAGDYLEDIRARIARQVDGFYTVDEAAQILADSREGLDGRGWVKRLLLACSVDGTNHRLPIRELETRLQLSPNERPRSYHLLRETDSNAWLSLQGVGYAFPKAEGAAAQRETCPSNSTAARDGKTWIDSVGEYVVKIQRDGKYRTAKELFAALERLAGAENSPFEKGLGGDRGKLVIRTTRQAVSMKTVSNRWKEIRNAAA